MLQASTFYSASAESAAFKAEVYCDHTSMYRSCCLLSYTCSSIGHAQLVYDLTVAHLQVVDSFVLLITTGSQFTAILQWRGCQVASRNAWNLNSCRMPASLRIQLICIAIQAADNRTTQATRFKLCNQLPNCMCSSKGAAAMTCSQPPDQADVASVPLSCGITSCQLVLVATDNHPSKINMNTVTTCR